MNFMNRIFERWGSFSRDDAPNYNTSATQINDSLFELHKPPGVPSMQVLFFHGFQSKDQTDVHLSTWTTADGSCLWPKTWLVEEFPDAHVLCVKYSAEQEQQDIYLIGANVLQDIIEYEIGQIPDCPVILVGHSLGGLVIKQVCSMAHSSSLRYPKFLNFLNTVKAIFLYSTPHHGVSISPELLRLCNIGESLVGALLPLSVETARLNDQFNQISVHFNWPLVGFGETYTTELGSFGSFKIVHEASARSYCHKFYLVGGDHFSLCRPKSKSSLCLQPLKIDLQHILDISTQAKKELAKRLEEALEKELEKSAVLAMNYEYRTWTEVGQLRVNDENVLGFGSSGTVVYEGVLIQNWEAGQQKAVIRRPQKLAVKRLLKSHYKSAQKEIDLFDALPTHPNVVKFHCVEETKDFIYLVLERCSYSLHDLICAQSEKSANIEEAVKKSFTGKGLKLRTEEDWQLWDEHEQPSPQLCDVLRGIVEGLVHVHGQHIAHRDLKPHNVLISRDGERMQVKIADMGFSKQFVLSPPSSEQPTSDGHTGTQGWQAPEQLRKEILDEGSSQAADMFCLGCVLYYCITGGEHPFGDEHERVTNIILGNMNLFHSGKIISAEAEDLIKSLLVPVPANRPSARKVLNHPFFWNPEKRLYFLMEASDRLEGDRTTVPKFVKDVEGRKSYFIQCRRWASKVDSQLLTVRNRPLYKYFLVGDLIRLIRNRAHHFHDSEDRQVNQDVFTSKPEGMVKYFAKIFPRLLIEIYHVVKKHYEADSSFKKYFVDQDGGEAG